MFVCFIFYQFLYEILIYFYNPFTQRWFLDANIKCFDDLSHIIIGSVAIIFLFVIILLIPLVAGLVLLEDHFFIQVKNLMHGQYHCSVVQLV